MSLIKTKYLADIDWLGDPNVNGCQENIERIGTKI